MTRDKWKDVAEFAGISAIVASLIMVTFELKQNTDMTRAQIIQSRAETAVNLADSFYNSDFMPNIFVKAGNGEDLTEEEISRYEFWIRASLRNQDNNLQQYNQGLLPDHMPRAVSAAARNIVAHSTVSQRYWARSKRIFSDEFIEFVDKALSIDRDTAE
jgi:hypothetical protein